MWIIDLLRPLVRRWLTPERAEVGMAITGMVCLLSPLLLWVTFTPTLLKAMLSVVLGCFLLAVFFSQFACPEEVDESSERIRKVSVEEMRRLMGRRLPSVTPRRWRDRA